MKILLGLFLIALLGTISISAQNPELIRVAPPSEDVSAREAKKPEKETWRWQYHLISDITELRIAQVAIRAKYQKEHQVPTFQLYFFLSYRIDVVPDQISIKDHVFYPESGEGEFAKVTTDMAEFRVPFKSEGFENDLYTDVGWIVKSREFFADLSAQDVDKLVRSKEASLEYKGLKLSADPDRLLFLNQFFKAKLLERDQVLTGKKESDQPK